MQNLTVTLVQANQIWENKEANLANYENLIKDIESDLFVLPEMFHTGFSMNTEELGENMKESIGLKWLIENAQNKNAAFYTSLIIREKEGDYNRGVFVTPDGHVRIYDKRKTFGLAKEDEHYAAGNEETIVEFKNWKFQLQICYDLRFPEIVRNRIVKNEIAYDAILYVANWPEKRASHWDALLKARAIENQCYVIAVNRVGEDGKGLNYSGNTKVINAQGVEKSATLNKEECLTYVINKHELNKTRELLPFLKDR